MLKNPATDAELVFAAMTSCCWNCHSASQFAITFSSFVLEDDWLGSQEDHEWAAFKRNVDMTDYGRCDCGCINHRTMHDRNGNNMSPYDVFLLKRLQRLGRGLN
jgi:hypothetical protein